MFRVVVAGTDGSPSAERAVTEAIDLAKSQGARLHLVAAFGEGAHMEPIESSARVATVSLRDAAESVLARAARKAEGEGVDVDYAARGGAPADVIIDAALEHKADVIVVGSKGMARAQRFLLGSVPNKVSHHAPCSVMIVRTD